MFFYLFSWIKLEFYSKNGISLVLGHSLEFDNTFERIKTILDDPMIGEPSLDYYKLVETNLHNRALATVQRLDMELKIFEHLAVEYEFALESLNDHKASDACDVD